MQRNTATRTEAAALKQTGRRWRVNQAAELVGDPPPPHRAAFVRLSLVRREESQLSEMMTKAELRRSQTQRHCRERMIRRH